MNTSIMSVVGVFTRIGLAVAATTLVLSTWTSTADSQGRPGAAPGFVTFVNKCPQDLVFVTPGSQVGGLIGVLPKNGGANSVSMGAFNKGGANVAMAYQTGGYSCPNCDNWTALGGPPGARQREGYMWQGVNVEYARFCNPNLSGRGICQLQGTCCGAKMTRDGTFGTHIELTPAGAGANDYINLSTNYGSGPTSPPKLCGPGVDPNDCVSKAANIFFNIPIAWETNLDCSFTTKGIKVKGGKCLTADCPDAYTHPTDDKQVACPRNPARWYAVTYCPA